jgi:hypothetical protein
MNEQQIAQRLRVALDESTERLPYRVTHRLHTARQAALGRMPRAEAPRAATTQAVHLAFAGAGATHATPGEPREGAPLWWRAAFAVIPALVVVVGLLAISVWSDYDAADETADVDLAVLTDDLPISAYADRGFGVYLKNSQQ